MVLSSPALAIQSGPTARESALSSCRPRASCRANPPPAPLFKGGDFPEAHGVVIAGADDAQAFAVTQEAHGIDLFFMAARNGDRRRGKPVCLPFSHTPKPHGLIARSRSQPTSVGAEGQILHHVLMTAQDLRESPLWKSWRRICSNCPIPGAPKNPPVANSLPSGLRVRA